MSGARAPRSLLQHATHAVLLLGFSALLYAVTRAVPEVNGGLWTVTAIGFLLLAGTLTSELLAPLGLPHLTGYLLAGIRGRPLRAPARRLEHGEEPGAGQHPRPRAHRARRRRRARF